RVTALLDDLAKLDAKAAKPGTLDRPHPWDALYLWGERHLTIEGQEYLVTLLLEPHGALIDPLADRMWADEAAEFRIDGTESCGDLAEAIARHHAWALEVDFAQAPAQARFWYVSEEK